MSLLQVTDLTVSFGRRRAVAVDSVSFELGQGQRLGIIGESGSGKTVTALALMGLLPEHAQVTGSVTLQGKQLVGLDDDAMSQVRGRVIGTVFQDPMSALTPVYTVGDQIAEALRVHDRSMDRRAARSRAVELLELVGIKQPAARARAFPHELSGGERQRVVIEVAVLDLLFCPHRHRERMQLVEIHGAQSAGKQQLLGIKELIQFFRGLLPGKKAGDAIHYELGAGEEKLIPFKLDKDNKQPVAFTTKYKMVAL